MQRMRKMQVLLVLLMFFVAAIPLNVKNVFAWYSTVQTKTFYCTRGGGPGAKMGITTEYGFIGPAGERNPQFYSALIAKGDDDECCGRGFFYIRAVKIEVIGIDPNGNPLQGDSFGDLTVLLSPDDSGVEQEILKIVWNVLINQVPYGLGDTVKNTVTTDGATTNRDAQKAWAEWTWTYGVPVSSCMERGLRFGYELNVDPTLEGTYAMSIHYSAVIYWDSGHGGGYEDTLHLYDTITYEYVNTPVTPSTPSGPTSGYRDTSYSYSTSTTDPNGDSLRYQFYWGDGSYTTTGWYTSGATASASHSWSSTGYKYVKVRAQDSTGAWSGWSSSLTVNINRAPNTPSQPSGPTTGYRNVLYTYSTSTTDPDGDNVRYQFEFTGPSLNVSFTTGWYASGQTGSITVMWENEDPLGTYQVRVRAQDVFEEWSCWSPYLTVNIVNGPPNTPSLTGTTAGYVGGSYTYKACATDPDGDSVKYTFYWGDGSTTTTGYYGSGVEVSRSHSWSSTGTYSVKVKATDVYGAYKYSSSLTVTIQYGGGGCPTLFVWNGTGYVDYGVINIHDVENDVVREVHVQAEDVSIAGHKVKFTLREGWEELNYSHSLIDQVKLYAVDNEGNRYLCPLIKAEHSDQGKILLNLLFSDDYRTDTYLMDTIDLTFIMPYPAETIENFTFIIEGHNPLKL